MDLLNMWNTFVFVITLLTFARPSYGYQYYHRDVYGTYGHRRHSGNVRRHVVADLRGETEPTTTPKPNPVSDCPLQCRCIAQSHLGYRDMAQRWMSLGSLNGQENTFKGTESPIWKEDPAELLGRDVVCMGLNKIPRPLPESVVKLTFYGDSSNMAGQGHAQITYIRDTSFVAGDHLEQLTISGNNLQILYPYIFRSLVNLQYLALQNNNITHISAASFAGLDQLKELRLSDNIIRFLSPSVFSHLVDLEFLFLNGNRLSMLQSHVLRRLTMLKHLDLSRNKFRTFSDTAFDSVGNLEELLINENQIWYVRSRWFQNLSRLTKLEIRANVITRIDPSSFKTLTNLRTLSLSANIINTVSNEAFKNLSQLEDLDISTNDVTQLAPDCFLGLDSLTNLDISVNRLSFINNRTFTATPSLRKLDLSKNLVNDIEEAALHPLSTLQDLDLSSNELKKIASKTFSGLLELRNVNLERNFISEVENDAFIVAPLNQLSKISWLSLQFNRLKSIDAYSLYGLPHLKFLNLGHNRIKTIHKRSFYTLNALQNLILNDNKIRSLEDMTFVNLKQLSSLTLENNKVAVISDNTFIGLRNLEDLNIVANGVETIAPNAFRHFSVMKSLKLQNNLLSTFNFDDLVRVKLLTDVDLSGNQLYDVKFPTQKTHAIRQLKLSNNKLQTLASDVINVLAPSGNLWLRENPLSCDCRLEWLPNYVSQYRLRLFGSRDTVCNSPATLSGKKIVEVADSKFVCDNTTVEDTLTCQNLQIRYTKEGQADAMRKGKKETRSWHVTFLSGDNIANTTRACFGMLINRNWVLTRQACSKAYIPSNSSQVKVKLGRRESRNVMLNVDYVTSSESTAYDLRLVRLSDKKKVQNGALPCILTHAQYHKLSRALPEGVFTTRFYKTDSRKWRLLAKRGKIMKKCDNNGDICLKSVMNGDNTNFQGSPLSLMYQGVWYLAGLGTASNTTDAKTLHFTPLWTVSTWIDRVIHEIDRKCKFSQTKKGRKALCEGLEVKGLVENSDVILV